ncbi:hypothetical protein MPER_09419 [Moniliophthora perniciosa FA553]|nr:hypothetical protein MPER_09419 [Moniliophthora perniciosa FA553]
MPVVPPLAASQVDQHPTFEFDPVLMNEIDEFLADDALRNSSWGPSGSDSDSWDVNNDYDWMAPIPLSHFEPAGASASLYRSDADAMEPCLLLPPPPSPLSLIPSPLPTGPDSVTMASDVPTTWDTKTMGRQEDMDLSNIIPGDGIVTRKRAAGDGLVSKRAKYN